MTIEELKKKTAKYESNKKEVEELEKIDERYKINSIVFRRDNEIMNTVLSQQIYSQEDIMSIVEIISEATNKRKEELKNQIKNFEEWLGRATLD